MKTKCGANKSYPLVFLGDSLISHWLTEGNQLWQSIYAPLGAINYGFISDSTQNIIDRILKDQLPALETAKTVVIMLGFTDLRFKLKERVILDQIKKIILLIQERRSGVKILILGILPQADVPERRQHIQRANNLLSTCENGFTVRFFDMEDKFIDLSTGNVIDALYNNDKSKLSTEGYKTWADSMTEMLEMVL